MIEILLRLIDEGQGFSISWQVWHDFSLATQKILQNRHHHYLETWTPSGALDPIVMLGQGPDAIPLRSFPLPRHEDWQEEFCEAWTDCNKKGPA